jgi:ankyrin repeat protein
VIACFAALVALSPGKEAAVPALCAAAHEGNVAEVRQLLARGAPPDTSTTGHVTALMEALQPWIAEPAAVSDREALRLTEQRRKARKLQIAHVLLAAGASVTVTDDNGLTPLHLLAMTPGDERSAILLVRELVKRGAAVDALSVKKVTPLRLAVSMKRFAVARALVTLGGSLDAPDLDGVTPASALVQIGRKDLVAELRKLGASKGR